MHIPYFPLKWGAKELLRVSQSNDRLLCFHMFSWFFPTSLCGVLLFGCVLPSAAASSRLLPTHNLHTHTQLTHTQLTRTPLTHTQLTPTPLTHTPLTYLHTTYTPESQEVKYSAFNLSLAVAKCPALLWKAQKKV